MRIGYLLAGLALAVCACDPAPYDIVLVGGTVIDGTGSDRFRADVAIRGDRILAVSRSDVERAGTVRVIDVTGKKGKIVAKNELGETILCTPAIANDALFVRSHDHLWKISR